MTAEGLKRRLRVFSGNFNASGYRPQADFLFILGMHRSGTSCLAGCLKRCGLYLGDVQLKNRANQRGNHELKKVERVHEHIFEQNGGRWERPPGRIVLSRLDRLRLAWIASRLQRRPPCGIKDPRMLFFLDIWSEFVRTYAIIGTYRHPIAVSNSLSERNNISFRDGIDIWLRYNRQLITLHNKFQFPLIRFDLSDKDLYCQLVGRCAEQLGLDPDLEQIGDFVSLELQHHPGEHLPVPEKCQELYAYLEEHRQVL